MTMPATDYAADRPDHDGAVTQDRDRDRLVWAPMGSARQLDGAWWPRSRNAAAEILALVPLVSEHLGGPVRRVSINIDAWDSDQPRRLRVGDDLVRLGWFRTIDPMTVTLGRHNDQRVTLLVIPPDLDPAEARQRLRGLPHDGEGVSS